MNGKEEKFFEKLQAQSLLCGEAGELLWDTFRGEKSAEDAYDRMRQIKRTWRAGLPLLHEKMQRAFHGEPVIEDVRVLVRKLDTILCNMKEILQRLTIYGTDGPEELKRMGELVFYALRELSRMMGYSLTLSEDYMKVEARAQKLLGYEDRSDTFFREGMAQLFTGSTEALAVIRWKDLYERTEDVLDEAAGSAAFFQKVTEQYI